MEANLCKMFCLKVTETLSIINFVAVVTRTVHYIGTAELQNPLDFGKNKLV